MYRTDKPYIEKILRMVESTRKYKNSIMPASSDGIGTKGIYHWQHRTFRAAMLDALTMNLNDMAVIKGRANYVQDHIMLPRDDEEAIYEIVGTLVEECNKRGIEITAGETSIHDNLNGLEISLSVYQGYYTPKDYLQNIFPWPCDLIGIKSSGLHSNGFTKIRELYGNEFKPEFVEPTLDYYGLMRELDKEFAQKISGRAHITGGGYTRLRKFLPEYGIDIIMDQWVQKIKPKAIFNDIYSRGVTDEEMYKTFNCGIGFVLCTGNEDSPKIIERINENGFEALKIGETRKNERADDGKIIIYSAFSGKKVVL